MFGWIPGIGNTIDNALGLGGRKSSADFFSPEARGFTYGIDDGRTVERDTSVTWNQAQQDYANQLAARERQMQLANQLQAQTRGQGPSLANLQLQQALAQQNQQSMSMAASAPASQGALGYRAAIQANAQASQQAAATGAQMRAMEQLAAQQQLAGLLTHSRQQDLGARGQSIGHYSSIRQQQLAASMAYQQAKMQEAQSRADAYNAQQAARAEMTGHMMGSAAYMASHGVFGGGGGGAAAAG